MKYPRCPAFGDHERLPRTRDLYLTQRFARHSSPLTPTIYAHPSDEELYSALRAIKRHRSVFRDRHRRLIPSRG